jgi:hypothetical protein
MILFFSPDCSENTVIAKLKAVCDCFVPRNDRLQRKAGKWITNNSRTIRSKKKIPNSGKNLGFYICENYLQFETFSVVFVQVDFT